MLVVFSCVVAAGCGPAPPSLELDAGTPPLAAPCGTGTWRPGRLEIHHIDVGQADSTLIVSPTGRSLLVDAGEPRWDGDAGARTVGAYLRTVLGCARLDQVLLTHFHVDHVGYPGRGGLWHLVETQGFEVGRTLHRNLRDFAGEDGGTLRRWREYLAGAGQATLRPRPVREGDDQIDLGPGVSVRVVAVDGHGVLRAGDFSADRAPPNENDYSAAILLRFGKLDYLLAGDLTGETTRMPAFGYSYHDVESAAARGLPDVDVYRVAHHGSEHSSGPTLLAQIRPEVSIVSCGDGNTFGHPHQSTVDRLLASGALYLTERGDPRTRLGAGRVSGHVVLVTTSGLSYLVGGERYEASDPGRTDADGDGYFREADPDDGAAGVIPQARGGCDPNYQACP
jgi:competence protein ComEC